MAILRWQVRATCGVGKRGPQQNNDRGRARQMDSKERERESEREIRRKKIYIREGREGGKEERKEGIEREDI